MNEKKTKTLSFFWKSSPKSGNPAIQLTHTELPDDETKKKSFYMLSIHKESLKLVGITYLNNGDFIQPMMSKLVRTPTLLGEV